MLLLEEVAREPYLASLDNENIIQREVFDLMLEPYSTDCNYLKRARIDPGSDPQMPDIHGRQVSAEGDFSIPYCYYAKGGRGPSHFNATESILCFNQLTYVFLAERIRRRIAPELDMKSMNDFKNAQMDRCWIGKYELAFKKPIHPSEFKGKIIIQNLKSMANSTFYKMEIKFWDNNKGNAYGKCTIAIGNS